MDESNLPRHLWGEAVLTATLLINRCPSKAINFGIPAEIFGKEMMLEKLKIFGSKGWMVVMPKRDKFDKRAIPVRMVGYAKTGYKVWDPVTDSVIVTRDVRFDETDIRFEHENVNKKNETDRENYYYSNEEVRKEIGDKSKEEVQRDTKQNEEVIERNSTINNDENSKSIIQDETTAVQQEEGTTSRSGRVIRKPEYLGDYELHQAYCLINIDEEPQSYNEAIDNGWNEAIDNELNALEKMNTWTETDLPENKKAIDAKWIFKVKENGLKKARLVARGFQLKEQEDFGKNYAPVARTSTVRTLLAHAVHNGWPIRQLDVPTAFLNGKIESEVYIKPPQGVKIENNKVLKLNRGLYGLRESPKCWNQRFDEYIQNNGFTRSKHDFCLYHGEEINVWLVIYVDDIILTGIESNVEKVIEGLKEEFQTKDFGEPKSFLGMEIQRERNYLKITQKRQINKMLEKFGMRDCKGTKTPLIKGYQHDDNEMVIDVPYRQIIGSLMFVATVSRPDIAYATSYLSQYLDKPTKSLWTQAKRTLRYLRDTENLGLTYERNDDERIETYSDADWAGSLTNRKSVSGSVTLYNGSTVAWLSRKQQCVSLSTVEAEYVAAATSACDLLYIKGLYNDFNGSDSEVNCVLYMDNKGAIQLTKSYENSKRTKHIDIKAHFVKELVLKKEMEVEYISTDTNLADLLTKSLSNEKLSYFRQCLNIV